MFAFAVGPVTTESGFVFLRKFFKGHFSVLCWGTQIKLISARFLQKGFLDTQMNGRLAHLDHHQNGCGALLAGMVGKMQSSPFK